MVDPKEELKEHKERFKDNIRFLINNGNIKDALSFIAEYEKIQTNDIDVVNMKAVIKMMENKLEEAEEILWQGVELDNKNKDLLYNFGYLYEGKGEIQAAVNFYGKLLQQTDDAYERKEISATILKLKLNENTTEKKFIILSSCPWGLMLQRPHHIARSLSRFGYSVDYVQPSSNATTQDSSVNLDNAIDYSRNLVKKIGFINIHTPVSVYHNDRLILNNYKEVVQELINSSNEEVILVCYFPSHINIIKQLTGNFKVVYECVDDHSDLEYSYWSSKSDREDELKLLTRANVITTTSSALYLSKSQNRENVFLSKNAVNIEDFEKNIDGKMPTDICEIPSPRVCYVGAVDRWFDEELFYNLVRANRDKSFIVIGPVKDGMLAGKEENLYILGLKEHKELKNYLRYVDVGIIPFKDDTDIIVNCDPIKMYEYVISGLPVVATNMPELALGIDYIKVCNGLDEFNKSLEDAVKEKIDKQEIAEFIRDNTWIARAKQLLSILEGNTKKYNKKDIVKNFQTRWGNMLVGKNNPILQSLYALTFAETDTKMFYQLAKEAYMQLKISFTLNNYAYASILTNNLIECANVIADDSNVDDAYRAELMFLLENNLFQIINIRLLHIAKKYHLIKEEIEKLKDIKDTEGYDFELANYYYSVGNNNEANLIYNEISGKKTMYISSPLFNKNISEISIQNGRLLEGKDFKEIENKLIQKYLGKQSIKGQEVQLGRINENRPRFSVVIPTRNSHSTLKYTLKTCLNQQFDNYEIVVSDNSSNESTKELINKLENSRIKYYKPDRELSMTENFNFAISKANGEYILVLGSDDGLLLHALKTLDSVLYALQTKIIHWYAVPYGWPDVKLEGYENYFQIPKIMPANINHRIMEGESVINSVINLEIPYSSLPMLYCNSVVHSDLISELKEKTGSIFKGLFPDAYSGFALAYIQQKYVTIDVPMTIGGSSGKSIGIAHAYGKDSQSSDLRNDFKNLNNRTGINRSSILPGVNNTNVEVAEAFLTAKSELFPTNTRLNVNRKRLAQKCAEDLNANDDSFSNNLQKIYKSLDDDLELKVWFLENYINNPKLVKVGRGVFRYTKGFSANGVLNVDLKEFAISDVNGAAEFFRKITGW